MKELTRINTRVTSRASWKFEVLKSLESLKIWEVLKARRFGKWEKWIPQALYIGGGVGRELPRPKFREKISIVGSSSHRRTWETRHRVEHLMKCCGLRSIRNSYRTREATFSRGKNKEVCGTTHPRSKPHFFSSDKREKLEFWGAIVGYKNSIRWSCHVSCPRPRRPIQFREVHTFKW